MKRMMLVALSCSVLLAIGSLVTGADFDGEVEHAKLTRKPVQILPGIGVVDFRITCQHEQTQQYFRQGIALLHGYDSREADRAFYQACRIEPDCAMTWWGLAAANEENRPLAAFYVERARQLEEAVSDRERMWIRAWRPYLDSGTSEIDRRTFLVTSLDRIFTRYPDDLEAAAFLVRQLLRNRDAGLPIPLTSAADLLIEQVLRHNPTHPAHHYKLLLWEEIEPQRAQHSAAEVQRGLPSAVRIQTAAGRVFARLERNEDALSCLEAASAAACQRIKLDRSFPAAVDGFFENAGLQIDQLALAGRVDEAIGLSRQLIEMPVPESPTPATTENLPTSHGHRGGLRPRALPVPKPEAIGQQKLLRILVDFHRWEELLKLADGNYFASTDREIQLRQLHAVGLAQFSRRDADAIAVQIEALRQLRSNLSDLTTGVSRSIQPDQIDEAIRELQWCEAIARNQQPSETAGQRLAELFPGPTDRTVAERLAREPADPARGAALYWQPPQAPPLRLSDRHGNWLKLESLRGQPAVLVFYRGAGCPHCIEQLRSFAPLKEAYEQAGLTVIAISTDSVAGLQETFKVAGAGDAIPFQLVSDEQLSAFRDFGAYDSRDNEPLHGTFLIDPQGRIVWHNIRREPFMATGSLLDEARRVFSLGEVVRQTAASGAAAE